MSKRRRPNSNISSAGRWLMIGSEIPIMVVAGAYIGRYIGEQIPWIAPFSIIIGAFLGFGVGVYNTYKVIQVLERREKLSGETSVERSSVKEELIEKKAGRRRGSASNEILELLKKQREAEDPRRSQAPPLSGFSPEDE
ncbi:MAG: AtpZ/AtpI family protein [Candidatus Jordarchaeales archaeon]|nr:AtpZ/AtpI family protein [Candidatus Jordarchaeia archaeon]